MTDAEVINGITYQVTRPNNAPSGKIDGAEISYTQFLDFLPAWLQGMGVQANGTYVNGDFQNISKWSYNVVGILRNGSRFGARRIQLALWIQCGRHARRCTTAGASTIYAKSQPWLDLSASYRIVDSLTLTFDATNLLNSYYQDYFGNQTVFPRDTRRFDRQFSLGIRYRLK